jgi:hypothetical protein
VVVAEASAAPGRVGRTPQTLALNPAAGLVLGLDFGHARVGVVAADAAHAIVGSATRPYPRSTPWEARCAIAVRLARKALAGVVGDDRRDGGGFRTAPSVVNLLDVSPSRSADGRTVHIAVINRSATDAITAALDLDGGPLPATATLRGIGTGVDGLFATNSIADPDAVRLTDAERVHLPDGSYTFPAHSVTLLSFALDTPV